MAWPRRVRRYQRWWGYPPQYPYAYPPQQYHYTPYAYPPPMYPPAAQPMPQFPEDELAALEDYKKDLEDEKASLEQEISDVEARIKELKAMLEKGGGQSPGRENFEFANEAFPMRQLRTNNRGFSRGSKTS